MKKLLFTAVAVVAFSGVTFANKSILNNLKENAPGPSRDCCAEGDAAKDCAVEAGVDYAQAEEIGECVTEKCLAATAQPKSVSAN